MKRIFCRIFNFTVFKIMSDYSFISSFQMETSTVEFQAELCSSNGIPINKAENHLTEFLLDLKMRIAVCL